MVEQKNRQDADEDIEDENEEDPDKPLKKDGEEDEDEDEGEDDDLIPVRRSSLVAKDHIIARQKRKIEKLGKRDEEEAEEDEEGKIDEERIVSRVNQMVDPIRKHLASKEDEDELRSILDDEDGHPFAKDLEKSMRKYMAHDSWKGVPIEAIYRHLAFEKAAGQRTDKKNAADLEARKSRSGGHQRRPKQSSNSIPELDDIDEMSDDDFENLKNKAKSGKFL